VKPVTRDEVLDYQSYGHQREAIRARMMETKAARRIHLRPWLTFLFENRDTVRYQVQEMMRAEQIVREDAIRHEIETYNELLGGPGELGATLLIEIDDEAERERLLTAWRDLPGHIFARFEDGSRAYARFDERQRDEQRVSSVQFLRFACAGRVPVALGVDFEPLRGEVTLTTEQRQALAADLAG
jgi:hypothetical protein